MHIERLRQFRKIIEQSRRSNNEKKKKKEKDLFIINDSSLKQSRLFSLNLLFIRLFVWSVIK